MKKTLLLLLVTLLAQTAKAKIWLVDNNSTNFLTSVQAALDSANVSGGDTVMVFGSTTNYADIVISNPVVLIGEGMNNIYGDSTTFDQITILSSNVYIAGVKANAIRLQTSSVLNNILIERCWIDGLLSFKGQLFGQAGFGKFSNLFLRNNLLKNTVCSLHDVSGGGYYPYVEMDSVVFENNIFDNVRFERYIPTTNLIGLNRFYIINNNFIRCISNPYIFANAFGNLNITDITIENNVFHTSNPQACIGCIYNNNLTYNNGANDTITTGTGNIIGNPDFIGYTNGTFNFQDFNLNAGSPAIGNGTLGTNIGTTGGIYPLAIGEGARIPLLETINISNFAVPQLQDFFLDLTARARRNFSDAEIFQEIKYSFDTILPFGQGTDLLPLTQGLNVSYTDSIPPVVLDSGLHTITFIARDSKGAYSFPRTVPFNVCTYNEVGADFNLYQSGRDVILDANYNNALNTLWDFGDGQTSTQQQNSLVHHFDSAAFYTINLNNSNPCFNASSSKPIFISGINTISPTVGGNIGVVTMTITGAGFNDSATVKLVKAGQQNITSIDSSTTITNGTVIQTAFDLSGVALGLWDVMVENPDTTFITIAGFEIDSMTPIITATQIIGSNFMRLNTWHDYTIIVENKSNVDVVAVPTWFAVPDYMGVQLNFEYDVPNDTSVLWDTIPIFFVVDTLFDKYYNYKVYGFILPRIPASNISDIIRIKLKRTTGPAFPLKIIAWTKEPLIFTDSLQMLLKSSSSAGCSPNLPPLNCMACLTGSWLPGPAGCIVSAASGTYSLYCDNWKIKKPISFSLGFYSTILSCSGATILPPVYVLAGLAGTAGCVLDGGACNPPESPPSGGDMFPIQAQDPNEKYGSTGASNSPYLNSQSPINYSIHFENLDTATASAQTVILIDTLDKSKLDLNTFQLTSIGFADTIIPVPAGRKSFTTNVDLQPNLPLVAQVTAYLNDTTGILTSSYLSLDPLTLEPTDSVSIGFLLPNDSNGRGEGFVSFSVHTVNTIQTGDTINNAAHIFFDENAPIVTPTWKNIIDNLKPYGQVTSATQISSTDSINVSWVSNDNGPAGVYAHNVYYNVNGGAWLLWKYNTSLTSDVFIGVMDSTYGFYSIAIDSAYNVEDAPPTADATTTLTVGVEEINQSQMIVKLFPNPANSTLNVFIKRFDKSKNDFNIIAREITGRTVSIEKINITTESKTIQLDISQFVSGIYFFEITDGEHRTFKKLIKN